MALVATALLTNRSFVPAVNAAEIHWQNERFAVQCDPASLQLTLTPTDAQPLKFLWSATNTATVADLQQSAGRATWRLLEPQLTVALQLETNGVRIEFSSAQTGTLGWPNFTPGEPARGWILPLFEGVYVGLTNSAWREELLSPGHDLNTTADLGLPFWGLDAGDFTLTCLLLNPFNNEVHFEADGGRMRLHFAHEFTRNNPVKQLGFRFVIGPNSPIEPAREYRRWLQANGQFVTLADKIKHTPEAEKLLGAPHAYLWGDAILSAADVKDWKGLAKALQTGGAQTNQSPAKHIWSLLDAEAQKAAAEILKAEWPDRYNKGLLAGGLNHALAQTDFYDAAAWQNVALPTTSTPSNEAELCRRNSGLLVAALGEFLQPPTTWGEGVSPQMIQEIAGAGFDRMWLGAEGWAGFLKRPETVTTAREHGFLIGTYDSFHSIHSPDAKPDQTWPTAQFDAELFRSGGIINADGQPRAGFKKRGYVLSPIAARPWVERRVAGLMKQFSANSWFIDCDGFGEYFDDYSTNHPATQASDMAERIARCAWIRDTYGAVIGTEGCSAGMAGTAQFAHGVLTPVIGWGDAELTSRGSKYFLGAYYPPGEPAVFFKPVPLKEKYRKLFYDPAVRLPLFQTAFHDSVVATHHWSNPSRKFPEVAGTVELLELLYNVPPLYQLNRAVFAREKAEIKRHYDVFSPLHRKLALLPLTDFRWLTRDKQVQTVRFGDVAEITANFSLQTFTNGAAALPAQTLEVRWLDGLRPAVRFKPEGLIH
jgi:hypothetical protein